MPDKHIVDVGGCLLPHRQGKDTVFHVEHRRLYRAVLYNKILGSEEASEIALDFGVEHRSLSLMNLLYDERGAVATPVKLF
jgi:hypothetical protein